MLAKACAAAAAAATFTAAAAAAADIGGEGVVRAYTPISGDRDPGVLEFLIKVGGALQRQLEGCYKYN
jgi:hypothetical protein